MAMEKKSMYVRCLSLGPLVTKCVEVEPREAYRDVTRGIMVPVVMASTRRMKGIIDKTL